MSTIPIRLPARASVLALWIDELYRKLREVETRAALPHLTLPEHEAAVAAARYIAGQIELYEQQVNHLTIVANDEPPGAGETPRRF